MEIRTNRTPSFFEGQKADTKAACERLMTTRKMLKEYKAAINATNTVDIAGEHRHLYEELEATMNLICLQEQQLILQGE